LALSAKAFSHKTICCLRDSAGMLRAFTPAAAWLTNRDCIQLHVPAKNKLHMLSSSEGLQLEAATLKADDKSGGALKTD
jgi:hypothetical protein